MVDPMSYDICLRDSTGNVLESDEPHDIAGGTYAVGGTTRAEIDITYNYAPTFYALLGDRSIRSIYGMTGADSLPVLKAAADKLSGERGGDYWASTDGNVKAALLDLVRLAEMFPAGVWDGD